MAVEEGRKLCIMFANKFRIHTTILALAIIFGKLNGALSYPEPGRKTFTLKKVRFVSKSRE